MFSRLINISIVLFLLGVSGFLQSTTGVAGAGTINLLNTITVNSTADEIADNGLCTLREAITAANTNSPSGEAVGECVAGGGTDLILLPAGIYKITRAGAVEDENQTGDFDIRSWVVLRGAGADQTIIDGNQMDRVIQGINSHLEIEDLSIINGLVPTNEIFINGGGIAYLGATPETGYFALRRVVVRNNRAANVFDPLGHGGDGGGIYMDDGVFILEESEVSNNQAGESYNIERGGFGGAIYAGNAITGSNFRLSTISGNSTPGDGGAGGVHLISSSVRFTQMTIANNRVGDGNVGIGGGIVTEESGPQIIKGSIIANNQAAFVPDCGAVFTSEGGNLIGNSLGCGFTATTGDQIDIEAGLDFLQDNGGSTRTHALLDNSPALDYGACDGESTDQRGEPRPVDLPDVMNGLTGCDAGAYERQAPIPTATSIPTITATVTSTPTITITPSATVTPTTSPTPQIQSRLYLPLVEK